MSYLQSGVRHVALALALGLSACTGAATEDHAGHGKVVDVHPAAHQITLDHGNIPGLMKGMTMTFELAPGVALVGIEAGSVVDFRVKEERGVYTVTEIRRSGP